MTEKLYYSMPQLKTWEAEIIDVVERDEKYLVLLDKTAFYPEGGGQPSDRGYIEELQVLDVFEEGKNIFHTVKGKPKKKRVTCSLDYERRQDLMQQHSGQHLLSSVFYEGYMGETSSFHLGEDYVSIDISLPEINDSLLKEVEIKVNELIYKNLEIKTYLVQKEELDKLPLRKFPKVEEDIRIVEIDNIDYSPCCGTHVNSTGELGIIKIIKAEKYKGITRVYFKCGRRALLDFQKKQDNIAAICRILAVDIDKISEKVEKSIDETKSKLKEIKELKEKLYGYEAKEIINSAASKVISINFKDRSFEDVQDLGKSILQQGEYVLIISSEPDKKLWFAFSGNFDLHCGRIFKEKLLDFKGRGGGGEKQAQASFEDEHLLSKFMTALKDDISLNY